MKLTQLKYKEVEKEIRQLALTLPPGAKLPPERHLAVVHKCNFLTVRKALKTLVDENLITRRMGSGTFVNDQSSKAVSAVEISHPHGNRVGILVYQGSNTYGYKVVEALAHVAMAESIELRSCWVKDFDDEALRMADKLGREGCAALILPWFPLEMTENVKAFVQACPIPVSLPMIIPGLEKNCFEKSELFGSSTIAYTQALCRYYRLLGRERIAFLGPDSPNDVVLQQALSSYSCYTSREGLSNMCGLVGEGTRSMDAIAQRWLQFKGDLAIISYDDEHALRLMTSMHKLGCGAPNDFWIVGYNNTDASRFSDPPLSTISQQFDSIGHWLLQNALALSKGQTCQRTEPARNPLLIRGTCGGRGRIVESIRLELTDLDLVEEDKLPANHSRKTALSA